MRHRHDGSRGFTLIELMVVIVLIGLLAGAVGVGVFRILHNGEKTVVKNQIKEFEKAIAVYRLETGRNPESLSELTQVSEGSEEPFLEGGAIPRDPWKGRYVYDPRGGTKKRYLIVSPGPDLTEGTADDITSDDLIEDSEE